MSERLAEVTGRWTGKRWSRAPRHAGGQSNKRAAVKNQYLLINSLTLLPCKSLQNNVCVGTVPLARSLAPSKPKDLAGGERRNRSGAQSGALPNDREEQPHRLVAMLV